jgi:hypothetical protein
MIQWLLTKTQYLYSNYRIERFAAAEDLDRQIMSVKAVEIARQPGGEVPPSRFPNRSTTRTSPSCS